MISNELSQLFNGDGCGPTLCNRSSIVNRDVNKNCYDAKMSKILILVLTTAVCLIANAERNFLPRNPNVPIGKVFPNNGESA